MKITDTLWESDALWLTMDSYFASKIQCICYLTDSLEFLIVFLALTASAAWGKQSAKQNIIILNSTFHNSSGGFLENDTGILSGGHSWRLGVTLILQNWLLRNFFFWQIVLINYMSEKITLKYDWLRAGQFVFNS